MLLEALRIPSSPPRTLGPNNAYGVQAFKLEQKFHTSGKGALWNDSFVDVPMSVFGVKETLAVVSTNMAARALDQFQNFFSSSDVRTHKQWMASAP